MQLQLRKLLATVTRCIFQVHKGLLEDCCRLWPIWWRSPIINPGISLLHASCAGGSARKHHILPKCKASQGQITSRWKTRKHGTFNKQETSRTERGVAELFQFAQTPTITKSTNGLMAMRSRPYIWQYQNKKVNLGLNSSNLQTRIISQGHFFKLHDWNPITAGTVEQPKDSKGSYPYFYHNQ